MRKRRALAALFGLVVMLAGSSYGAENGPAVNVDPAPAGEALSTAFSVSVEGKACPVYVAKVAPRDPKRRWKGMDDKKNLADYFDTAAFATFDMRGEARVTVTCPASSCGTRASGPFQSASPTG